MMTIELQIESGGYPVYLGRNLLGDASLWRRHLGSGKILVVSNEVVAPLYLETVTQALSGLAYEVHVIPDGEPAKTVDTWFGIIDKLVTMEARRDACIIALGGGVVGDIAGFAAACYMRGVRFVQVPTTLLAQVDASVGGKTGINHSQGKNLVGAFHQPTAVLIDSDTLATLPEREFKAGLAEVVKYGAIRDPGFFAWLEEHAPAIDRRDREAVEQLIHRSVVNKAEIVAQDEKETGVRALLNFGHSFGHALETETAYRTFLHGEAVAIGMVIAATLSEARGLCSPGAAARLSALLCRFGLPVALPASTSRTQLMKALQLDKKAVASGLRLVLLEAIGQATIDTESSYDEIVAAIHECQGSDPQTDRE